MSVEAVDVVVCQQILSMCEKTGAVTLALNFFDHEVLLICDLT